MIHVRQADLPGVLIVEPQVFRDDRGFFLESYHQRDFAERGIPHTFVQDNHSHSRRGVLRGIHLQDGTAPMAKLVRCPAGSILDVAVDLRAGSPTFGKWVALELNQDNLRELWVPVGFGHAFLTLSEWADVQYKCTGFYTPAAERTVIWDDPEIGIAWPIAKPLVSLRDSQAETLRDYATHPAYRYQETVGSADP